MTIGIIGAMDEEIELLKKEMTVTNENTIAGCTFINGVLEGKDVVLTKSGIGKVNAAMAASILHERFHPSVVINTGSAGGFAKDLEVGDIVISTEVVHHDVDVTAFSYEYGQVPGLPAAFEADSRLVELAYQAAGNRPGTKAKKGMIATGDIFMQEEARIDFARSTFPNMIAAEMEAAAIAQVCHRYGIPFVVTRALSDIAGKDSSVSFDEFLKKAAENAAKIIIDMLKSL